jgi:hypothetical protein
MNSVKVLTTAIATAGLLALGPAVADAAVINFGVDILSNGTVVQGGFNNGDDTGFSIDNADTPFMFFFNTPGLLGATIHRFELFIDATDVSCHGTCDGSPLDEKFWLEHSTGGAAGTWSNNQGYLQETGHAATLVPVHDATFGNHVATPYNGPVDIDNTFYLYSAPAAALQTRISTDGSIYFRINSNNLLGDTSFRFDAANLEVEYTPASGGGTGQTVPEPATLLMLGMGFIAAGRAARRKH